MFFLPVKLYCVLVFVIILGMDVKSKLYKAYIVFMVSKNKIKLVQSSRNNLLAEVLNLDNLLGTGKVSSCQLTEGEVHYFLLLRIQFFNLQIKSKKIEKSLTLHRRQSN